MYNNVGSFGFSIATPATAAMLPMDFPLGIHTEPFWLVIGGFAIFAACQAVKRIAPTWHELTAGDEADELAAQAA